MSDCVVGICAAIERVRWGPWDAVAAMMPRSYVTAVQAAGAAALLLPPDGAAEALDPLLNRIDGLILAGGSDVDPATYGARPHPETNNASPERDRFEIVLAQRALDRELPLLGICRGMQMLNVATGGTLLQHLPDVLGHSDHCHTAGAFADHEIRLEPGSLAAEVMAAEGASVKSHHHQGLDRLGAGVVASGWAVGDDLVEAVELPESRFGLGVLWHPEEEERDRVVAALVAAARAAVAAR